MKPGWKTSEFWIALIGQVLAVLALTGAIGVGDRDRLETALTNMVTAIFTIAGSTVIVVRYIRSRSALKSQQLAATDGGTLKIPLLGLALLVASAAAGVGW